MTIADREPQSGSIQLRTVSGDDKELIAQAVKLGDLDRRTLGFLPPAGYIDAAARETLLAAMVDDVVVGYALYRLSRGRVALAHLCIRRDHRRHGLARQMVEEISRRHADHLGVLVKCRHSYGLDRMWIRLGFRQRNEMRGRSKEGHPLVVWWLDHGHTDLLSRAEPATLRAAVDLNVLRDLVDAERTGAVESASLRADYLIDQLELVVTPALHLEIAAMDGADLRRRCTQMAGELTDVRAHPQRADEVESVLLAAIKATEPSYPRDSQDCADLRHVAEAAAAGITVLVSRDEALARMVGAVAARDFGLRILRPVDVLLHVDELTQAQVYRPAAIAGSGYRSQRLGAGREEDMLPFANSADHERPRDFRRRLRQHAMDRHAREAIIDPEGRLVALYVTVCADGCVDVPVLRVRDHSKADTLARQLLFTLRKFSRDQGRPILRITDPHPSTVVVHGAIADGFRNAGSYWYTFVLNHCADADEVWEAAVGSARQAGLTEPGALPLHMPAVAAAEIERIWWPAKLLDSQMDTYVVSIQPRWSVELFGVPPTLTPRAPQLALSRDHVYYRSPKPAVVHEPARILWYLSSDGRTPHPAGIIACSQLDSVTVDSPASLYERFRHLGVWRIQEIEQKARQGVAQALRFSNTDIFTNPVRLARLRQLSEEYRAPVVPQAPRRIPAPLFAAIYKEGYKL
jgi:GNAT superfamily N-acetyltransferase